MVETRWEATPAPAVLRERTLTKVTVQGNATVGGVNQKNVIYETEEKNYTPHHGDRLHGDRVGDFAEVDAVGVGVADGVAVGVFLQYDDAVFVEVGAQADGSKEKYAYQTVERLVNTAGAGVASQRVSTNQSYLLNWTVTFVRVLSPSLSL